MVIFCFKRIRQWRWQDFFRPKPPNAKNLRLRLQALYLWKLDNCLTNFSAGLILSPATSMFWSRIQQLTVLKLQIFESCCLQVQLVAQLRQKLAPAFRHHWRKKNMHMWNCEAWARNGRKNHQMSWLHEDNPQFLMTSDDFKYSCALIFWGCPHVFRTCFPPLHPEKSRELLINSPSLKNLGTDWL